MASAKALHTKTALANNRGVAREPLPFGTRVAKAISLVALVTLAGCAGTGVFAPIADLSDRGVDGTYRVQPGDTLSSISRETGVSVERLIALNDISNPSLIRVGQRLRLNDDAVVPAASMAQGSNTSTSGGSMTMDRGEVQDAPESRPAPAQVTPAADASKIAMVWPAKGEIIQRFTPQTKGIDIAGTIGEPVVAAAGGNVVFAGDAVRGFGNLVIVDHGDGFITAYAHNEKLLVKKGDAVSKSQQIATLGQSATTSPRLHFEVRRNGTPVDPLRYLPAQ
ncbi:peptidoglycan DD-metalloendopeptidase family protein [Orrella daihaiensis]|uniref:Peptidoglycan DD-metalloendopeptidase family protein n=1 Tax=Orrella daihaiensis TaxID=2782176 RepID=A0ABY4AG84_9BURK|nr:peptidoglycan DD-metalloendopeptidase family protein [Orrella daihaiensis]UOD49304.1 peptidoglycan DD-metalloendopeptidase family protein [Orrella daihaiensis]